MHTSYKNIRDALQWFVGNEEMKYTKRCVASVMKYLRLRGMVETFKTTRGIIVTICNYDRYQKEGSSTVPAEFQAGSSTVPAEFQAGSTINKNEKNEKNENNGKNNIAPQEGDIVKDKSHVSFKPPSLADTQSFFTTNGSSIEAAEDFINFYESKGWLVGKTKMKKWEAAARGWIKRSSQAEQSNISKSNYLKHDHDEF
ncbi:hypothetical protein [Ancylomarina sp. 16SWW S1-10-2]|uniref:hypothetical protein n=1 Tax=Ancylomarina sp. 16SWW S1-10-2 TaxID=2499681 RepID=UPI0012AE749B|nr:hypothetical protein [Ancylomarina sp. 16SWW S1-10-2]MRT92387.1 hypothetical protein [Ancylomarina sp. 16SWW S1-10-2]